MLRHRLFVLAVLFSLTGCQFNRRSGFVRFWADYNTLGAPAFFVEEQSNRAYVPDNCFKYHSWIDNRRTRPPLGFFDARAVPEWQADERSFRSLASAPQQPDGLPQPLPPETPPPAPESSPGQTAPGPSTSSRPSTSAPPPAPVPESVQSAPDTAAGARARRRQSSPAAPTPLQPARPVPTPPVPAPPAADDALPEPLPVPSNDGSSADRPPRPTAPEAQPEPPNAVLPHLETPPESERGRPFGQPVGPTARSPSAVRRSAFWTEQPRSFPFAQASPVPGPAEGAPTGRPTAASAAQQSGSVGSPTAVRPPGVWLFWSP